MKKIISICLVFLSLTVQAQQQLKGLLHVPAFIARTAIDNTIVGVGNEPVEYGKKGTYKKMVIWNNNGTLKKEVSISESEELFIENKKYTGYISKYVLSDNQKELLVYGTRFSHKQDVFHTVIQAYSFETGQWRNVFRSKTLNSNNFKFHPTQPNILIAVGTEVERDEPSTFNVYIHNMSTDKIVRKLTSTKLPVIPIFLYSNNEHTKLFITKATNTLNCELEIYNLNNYNFETKIKLSDHIIDIIETENEYYFCGTEKTFVYRKDNLKHINTLNYSSIIGIYPKSNLLISVRYNVKTDKIENVLYNLKTKKETQWTLGNQIIAYYDEDANQLITTEETKFVTYTKDYKTIFSAPPLNTLPPAVRMHTVNLKALIN